MGWRGDVWLKTTSEHHSGPLSFGNASVLIEIPKACDRKFSGLPLGRQLVIIHSIPGGLAFGTPSKTRDRRGLLNKVTSIVWIFRGRMWKGSIGWLSG